MRIAKTGQATRRVFRRRHGRQHPLEDAAVANSDAYLVTAAHAARQAAGEDEANHMLSHGWVIAIESGRDI